MIFKSAVVRGIKADIGAGEITISFRVSLNQIKEAEHLRPYLDEEAGTVDVSIDPHQIPMNLVLDNKTREEKDDDDDTT